MSIVLSVYNKKKKKKKKKEKQKELLKNCVGERLQCIALFIVTAVSLILFDYIELRLQNA
jgi:hypothetical protein